MSYPSDDIPWGIRLLQLPHRILQWMSGLVAILIWPLEFCIHIIARLFFGLFDTFDSVEFASSRLVWILFWPLRLGQHVLTQTFRLMAAVVIWPVEFVVHWTTRVILTTVEVSEEAGDVTGRMRWAVLGRLHSFGRGLVSIFDYLPRYVQAVLYAPVVAVSAVSYFAVRGLMTVAEALNLDGILFALIHWTRLIWYPPVALTGLIWIWCVTRSKRQLLWGLPVCVLLLTGIWITGVRLWLGQEGIAENYRIAVINARHDKNYDRVQLFEKKLAQLGVQTEFVDFRTALALAEDGNYDEAFNRMRALAPVDSPGYANAHIWIIRSIQTKKLDLPVEEAHDLVGIHLDCLASQGIKAPQLDVLRAYWLAEGNKQEEASALLKPLIHVLPTAAIERLRLDLALNHLPDARQDAIAVSAYMSEAKQTGTPLTTEDYRWWSVAEEVLGHKVLLYGIVADWLKLDPDNKEANDIFGVLSLRELDATLSIPFQKPEAIIRQIQNAFAIGNVSQGVKQEVIRLYQQRAANPALRDAFASLLQISDLPPSLAEALGTAAASEGDWLPARRALKQVVQQDPGNSVAWNNFAFVLLRLEDDANLDEALAAANKAIDLKPESFLFRETRGQILVKLGQWKGAVADLEYALNSMPEAPEIHESLAKAYDGLGNSQLAAVHRQHSN